MVVKYIAIGQLVTQHYTLNLSDTLFFSFYSKDSADAAMRMANVCSF